ncbi:MAG: deoxyguanosinetriphosphate triphosphohydrolase [Planctomycetes bacterium]|nr:deoxyguanosinetriphosphate triphosphohydrolase [Planctomycetota bacterium]
MIHRRDLEEREERALAPWATRSARSRGRVHPEEERPYRTAYQLDRDKIVHSKAFRRLEYKTQVFVNHEGDHYRTRLTHTLEVAQIGRTAARSLGLNEDLVEAIALAHDLGHAPFGHAGEEILDELMAEHGGFDHNQQGLRVVDVLEVRYPGFPGLNLTYEVREGIAKHTSRYDSGPGLGREGEMPALEAQLVDAADALAYDSHDIDDGIRSGSIAIDDLRALEMWREAEDEVAERLGVREGKAWRARVISSLIARELRDLVEETLRRIEAKGVRCAEDVRAAGERLVGFSAALEARKSSLETFLFDRVYRHYRVVRMAEKAKRFIAEIFREYCRDPRELPPEFSARSTEEGAARAVCDYIAGMTDRFCQDEYKRLFHPFERM